MESMADACLIVQGTLLPVHTQVLGLASSVLCRLFADLRSVKAVGGSGKRTRTGKRKADDVEQELRIEAPFATFSVQDVALFLRLVYDQRWQTSAAATFRTLHDRLAALLRLAHQLDAQQLLGALSEYMSDCSTAGTARLMTWLEAADACQLDTLRVGCLLGLARSLAGWGDSLPASLAHASLLERYDKRTLTQLLGIMTAAGKRHTCKHTLSSAVPYVAAEVCSAIVDAASPRQFCWTLEAFSEKPSGVGDYVVSPEFKAAGQIWRLRIYPGSAKSAYEGFVSVRLECMQHARDVCATYALEALDAGGKAGITRTSSSPSLFCNSSSSKSRWGWNQFASRGELAELGLLEGNSLRLRATVTLTS